MQSFTPGKPVTLTFSLLNDQGEALLPTALQSRVLDEDDTVLQDWVAVTMPDPSVTNVEVTVLGALNILTPPATRGARIVELQLTDGAGTLTLSETYMLGGSTALSFGVNTFLTYAAATVMSADFVPMSLAGWNAAERKDQEAALSEAYERIMRLPLGVHYDAEQSVLYNDAQFVGLFGPIMLRYLTPGQMAQLYPVFLTDLKRAQLAEADEILQGDPVRKARQSGLISNTVGESSQFFRTAKPLELPVSPRALEHLQRWVRFGAKIGRR